MDQTIDGSAENLLADQSPAEAFRGAMRLLAAGVVVVTTTIDNRPWGLTISACCSVSADPPRVLVSLGEHTSTWRSIAADGRFGVSLLSAKQKEVAQHCSAPGIPKFIEDYVVDDPDSHSPVLVGALTHLDRRLDVNQAVGDHQLVVGRVTRTLSPAPDHPLIYFERSFRSVADISGT